MSSSWMKILFLLGVSLSVVHGEAELRNITQWLDHTDPNNTATWENRYWVDESFYEPGGPIFLLVSDQLTFFTEARLETSHFLDLAEEFNALFVASEFRFFGENRPTPDVSLESLQYLSTAQGLGDLVNLITFIKESNETLRDAKVIAAGSGYGAALSVWLRQSRPDLVDGVWASSAWLHAIPDFYEFGTNTAVSIRIYGGMICYDNLAAAFEEMEHHFVSGHYEILRDGLNLCETEHGLNGSYAGQLLFGGIATAIGSSIQILHAAAMVNLCNDLSNATTPFEGLSNWMTNRVTPELGCTMIDYSQFLEFIDVEDWEADAAAWGTRQGLYQVCTTYGAFRTSNGDDHPFGDRFPMDFYLTQCRDLLNGTMTDEEIIANIERTNEIYGGLTPNVTNVYFTTGNLDPERTLSVREDLNEDAVADTISYFGFAADFFPMNVTINEGLRAVQNRVRTLIGQWLTDDGETPPTTEPPTETTTEPGTETTTEPGTETTTEPGTETTTEPGTETTTEPGTETTTEPGTETTTEETDPIETTTQPEDF